MLQKRIEIFKKESRDKIITEFFLQNYIINSSDILIVVVGDLTYSEQKLLNKIKSELMRTKAKELFVIHNLLTYTTRKQVEKYIKEILLKSATFNLDLQAIPNEINKCYYEKNTKPPIRHLLFACENSEAGDYYNQYTLDYLEKSYINITDIKPFDVLETLKERFKIVSKEILEKKEGENIISNKNGIDNIIFDNNKNVIKLIRPKEIKLKKCFIDELGFQNLKSNGFEPSYNCYRKGKEIIIKVEAPGDSKITTQFIRYEGFIFIRIIGFKNRDPEPGKDELNIFNSRESGEFILDIPFKFEDFWFKNKTPIINSYNGLFIIKFELEA